MTTAEITENQTIDTSFIVHSDLEIIQRLDQSDREWEAWNMQFSTLEESYNDFIAHTKK